MPNIDVTVVHSPEEPLPDTLAASLAEALGRSLGEPEGRVWVKLHGLASTRYAENGATQPVHPLPVFASVLLSRVPGSPAALQAHAEVVCATLSEVIGRPPGRVHLEYLPSGAGRVAFGGRLVPP